MYDKLIAEKIDSANEIKLSAEKDERELTEEEIGQIEALLAEAEELKEKAKKVDSLNGKLGRALEGLERPKAKKVKSTPSVSVEVDEPNFIKDPKKGFEKPIDFFKAIIDNTMKGIKDERLDFLATQGSDESQTLSDPYGGFLVPEGFSPNVLMIKSEADPTVGRTMNIPMSTPSINIPARVDTDHSSTVAGGINVYRGSETVDATASRAQFKQVNLRANWLSGANYVTQDLLDDSPISVAAIIEQSFGDAFRDKLFDEKLNGTGAGEYEGIRNSGCFISVTKESAQTADTIVFQNVVKMRARCYGFKNAIWLCNMDAMGQIAALNDGTNNIWMPSAQSDVPDRLLGQPIFFTTYTETLGDAGDILLCNFTQYLEGTYMPLQTAESIHVRFLAHETCFRFSMRNDGRSWWHSALTPRKGASTISPFVGLAART